MVDDDVGVEVVNVDVQSIHPTAQAGTEAVAGGGDKPKNAAQAYEEVMEADQARNQARYRARARPTKCWPAWRVRRGRP